MLDNATTSLFISCPNWKVHGFRTNFKILFGALWFNSFSLFNSYSEWKGTKSVLQAVVIFDLINFYLLYFLLYLLLSYLFYLSSLLSFCLCFYLSLLFSILFIILLISSFISLLMVLIIILFIILFILLREKTEMQVRSPIQMLANTRLA